MNSYLKGRKSARWREREETDFREKHGTLEVLGGHGSSSVRGRGRLLSNEGRQVKSKLSPAGPWTPWKEFGLYLKSSWKVY